jgi:hypothetical protein
LLHGVIERSLFVVAAGEDLSRYMENLASVTYHDSVLTSVPGSELRALLGSLDLTLLVASGEDVGSTVPGGELAALLLWGLYIALLIAGRQDVGSTVPRGKLRCLCLSLPLLIASRENIGGAVPRSKLRCFCVTFLISS